jgi:hypothetical protein
VDDGAGKNGKIPRIKKLESAASTGHLEAKRQLEEERICPDDLLYIWELWREIIPGRTPGFDGEHLTWQDLQDWSALRNFRLSQFEIEVLMELDSVKASDHKADDD